MSDKLFDEYPLLVLPSLAREVGLNEAIAIQQLHYWIGRSKHRREFDGKQWAPATWKWWEQQFPFWSLNTIRRAFTTLHKRGLIHVKQTARFNWYAIDLTAVRQIGEDRVVTVGTLPAQDGHPICETAVERKERKDASHPKESGERRNLTREIWDHYVKVMKPRRTQLDNEARRIINDALEVASAEELKLAIDGCYASDFHMGRDRERNPKGTKYNQLSQIIKGKRGGRTTREQIDLMIGFAQEGSRVSGFPSADEPTLRRRMEEARRKYVFPDDASGIERGTQAEAWLREHGYETVVAGEGSSLQVRFERINQGGELA